MNLSAVPLPDAAFGGTMPSQPSPIATANGAWWSLEPLSVLPHTVVDPLVLMVLLLLASSAVGGTAYRYAATRVGGLSRVKSLAAAAAALLTHHNAQNQPGDAPTPIDDYQAAILAKGMPLPESVNYHFLRQCNYECRFCFHTFKQKDNLPDMKTVLETLRALHRCGMRKINFSGGEPFLQPKRLAEMVRFCKDELKIPVTIVTNGSLMKESWLEENGRFVDYIALSCDSYDEDTSIEIGRSDGKGRGDHVTKVRAAAAMIHKYNIGLRVNSVVTQQTFSHDFHRFITQDLAPVARWKVFQMLLVEGENVGAGQSNGRDASDLVITDDEFAEFVQRHKDIKCMKVESNETMANSYVIVDERLRFLDTSAGSKIPSQPIPSVGAVAAYLESGGFDQAAYIRRDGRYEWERDTIGDVEDIAGRRE